MVSKWGYIFRYFFVSKKGDEYGNCQMQSQCLASASTKEEAYCKQKY